MSLNKKLGIAFGILIVVLIILFFAFYRPFLNKMEEQQKERELIEAQRIEMEKEKEREYIVKFVVDADPDNILTTELRVKSGSVVEKPEDPVGENFIFEFWTTDTFANKVVSEPYDFNTPVTSNLTLYAAYTKIYKASRENYDRIEIGMSKDEVIDILGEPGSISESETQYTGKTEMFEYKILDQDGFSIARCILYFHNGTLSQKNWSN